MTHTGKINIQILKFLYINNKIQTFTIFTNLGTLDDPEMDNHIQGDLLSMLNLHFPFNTTILKLIFLEYFQIPNIFCTTKS